MKLPIQSQPVTRNVSTGESAMAVQWFIRNKCSVFPYRNAWHRATGETERT